MLSTTRCWLLILTIGTTGAVVAACGSKGAPAAATGSAGAGGDHVTTQLEGGPPDTGLPPLPQLTNVVAVEREDSVGIDFDPIDNAVDYRVYPLPSPGDVTVNANGSLTIKGTIYRCAGLRQTFDLPNNTGNDPLAPDSGKSYENPNAQYSWTAKIPATPTLGYVYLTAAPDRVPVYAVAVHPATSGLGWRETRPKIYTTDANERKTLLGLGGRDDGIVFYVPSSAGAATEPLYHSETADPVAGQDWTSYTEYYFTSADVASHAMDSTPPAPAFPILSAPAAGAVPLMAVFYQPGMNHIELAAGNERFKRAANQGPGPLWHVEWSGITGPTTLVVEALASGCPYQGFLSPMAVSAPPHQPLLTLAQMQQASATGEVFINGQYDLPGTTFPVPTGYGMFTTSDAGLPMLQTPDASPVPIARSFIQVTPQPHDPSAWDWYEGFNVGHDFGPVTRAQDSASCRCQDPSLETSLTACQSGGGACGYWKSPTFEFGAYEVDIPQTQPLLAYGNVLGQFVDVFDDVGQDVTGTLRFTVPKKANVDTDPSKFLKITWSVNTVSTDRRYPQLILTDQSPPVQDDFSNPNSNFLLIQTRFGPSMHVEVQAFHGLVNGKPWAVNNQATMIHNIIDVDGWAGNFNGTPSTARPIPPAEPPFEHAGMDRMTKYVAFVSSSTLYLFMDDAPAGCMQMPGNGFALAGAVTVTFGDVLYHEGAPDELICAQVHPYAFMHEHQCAETKRQWDDLGFKSGVAAPAWDNVNFPCTTY
jgi:hypothetical protein